MNTTTSKCEPNPDVAGIGVRPEQRHYYGLQSEAIVDEGVGCRRYRYFSLRGTPLVDDLLHIGVLPKG